MPDTRRRTVLTVLVLVSLILVTLDYRGADRGPIAALQRGTGAVFGPLQEGLATITRPLADALGAVGDFAGLRSENVALRAQLDQALTGAVAQVDLQRQIDQLRQQLGMRQEADLSAIGARVFGAAPGTGDYTVLVDAGADQGVQPGMAVLNADGLVGRVIEVTAGSARVELLTSPEARYAVRLAGSGEPGLLTGSGSAPFAFTPIDAEVEVPPGMQVVTQEYRGSTVPDGLPIGVVAEPPADAIGRSAFHDVQPLVDFSRLGVVQVVLSAPDRPLDLDPGEVIALPEGDRPSPEERASDDQRDGAPGG